jgi:hypothetical protein
MTTNGFTVSIRPVLTKVFRYDKYNNAGEPLYNTVLQAITKMDKIESTTATTYHFRRRWNERVRYTLFLYPKNLLLVRVSSV